MSIVSTAVVKANMTSSGQPFLEIDPDLEKDTKTMKAVRQILDFMSEKWPKEYQSMIAFKGRVIMRPIPYDYHYTIYGKYLLQIRRINRVLEDGLHGKTELSRHVQCAVAGDFADMFYNSPKQKPKSTLVKWSHFCLKDPACLDLRFFCLNARDKPEKAILTLLAVATVVMVVWYATQFVEDPFCHSTVWIFLGVSLCAIIRKMQKTLNADQRESQSDYDKEDAQGRRRAALFIAKGLGKDTALEDLIEYSIRCVETLDLIKEIKSLKNEISERESKEGVFKMTQFPSTTSSGALLPYIEPWLERSETVESVSVRKMLDFISERVPEEYDKWIVKKWSVKAHCEPKTGIFVTDRTLKMGTLVIDGIRKYGLKGDTGDSLKIQVAVISIFTAMLNPSPKMKPPSNVFTRLMHLSLKEKKNVGDFIRLVAEHPKKIAFYATALNAGTFLERDSNSRLALVLLGIIPLLYGTYKAFWICRSEERDLENKWFAECEEPFNCLLKKCLGNEVLLKHQDLIRQPLA